MTATKLFIHGLESSGSGTKGMYFRQHFPEMIVEDYEGSFFERMKKLNLICAEKRNIILVGSSYGGLMAAVYALENKERVMRLVLLAPALTLGEFVPYMNMKLTCPVIIYHGSHDDVVPVEDVKRIASTVFADLQHHVVDDDHPLRESFGSLDWKKLLGTES